MKKKLVPLVIHGHSPSYSNNKKGLSPIRPGFDWEGTDTDSVPFMADVNDSIQPVVVWDI